MVLRCKGTIERISINGFGQPKIHRGPALSDQLLESLDTSPSHLAQGRRHGQKAHQRSNNVRAFMLCRTFNTHTNCSIKLHADPLRYCTSIMPRADGRGTMGIDSSQIRYCATLKYDSVKPYFSEPLSKVLVRIRPLSPTDRPNLDKSNTIMA